MVKAIELSNVSKKYSDTLALNNLNLVVEEGSFYGFIGPNGAGKSTAIRILMNMIYPTSGTAKIMGLDCVTKSEEIKKRTSYVSSDVAFYENMRVKNILNLVADFHQIQNRTKQINHYTDLFELQLNKRFKELSLGNKRKVALVCGLLPDPQLLILDEPTNGLDPLIQHRLYDLLEEKNKKGTTIFLSSHDLKEVQTHCERAAFIKDGIIVFEESLKRDEYQEKVLILMDKILM